MLTFAQQVHRTALSGTTQDITDVSTWSLLASVDKLFVQVRTAQAAGQAPKLTVALETSNDGRAWTTKSTLLNQQALTAGTVESFYASDAGATPSGALVRLTFQMVSSDDACLIVAWMSGRMKSAAMRRLAAPRSPEAGSCRGCGGECGAGGDTGGTQVRIGRLPRGPRPGPGPRDEPRPAPRYPVRRDPKVPPAAETFRPAGSPPAHRRCIDAIDPHYASECSRCTPPERCFIYLDPGPPFRPGGNWETICAIPGREEGEAANACRLRNPTLIEVCRRASIEGGLQPQPPPTFRLCFPWT